jgi:DNA-binding transcriptional MerR regulator
MKIEQRKFRIGTLAEKLEVERFVVRFWEKEFNIKSHRSSGKQRFYTEKDLERFTMIKELLYEKGFTIAGAKKFLKKGPKRSTEQTTMVASQITTMEPDIRTFAAEKKHASFMEQAAVITEHLVELQKKLLKLRELL